MDRMKEMFELRNAVKNFLENDLEADVQGAGMRVTEPFTAHISFKINNIDYSITIEEV